MRDIEFRAWDEPNKEWLVYDACWFYEEDNGFHCGYKAGHAAPNAGDWVNCPIVQYTGMKDKNGKKIFEGDILDFDEAEWGGKFNPEVVPSINHLIGEFPMSGSHLDVSEWRAVIGNIYENPELINKD